MTRRYALFLGAVAGLAAIFWVERATVGAVADELVYRSGVVLGQAGDAFGRWFRGETTSSAGPSDDVPPDQELPGAQDQASGPALPEDHPPMPPQSPSPPPAQAGNPQDLDGLFAALRRSDSAEAAERIEAEIFLRLSRSGSPTVDLMMNSAAVTASEQGQAAAGDIYLAVTQLEPGFAEGWARAAGVAFEAGEPETAERYLRTAVRLEPRHYSAWTGLGAVLESLGDPAGAAAAYREALWLNPWQDGARRGLLRAETASKGLPM